MLELIGDHERHGGWTNPGPRRPYTTPTEPSSRVRGDHLNDLGMFAGADESIAPADAHTSVLAAATAVVASNDDDGVIRWLLSRVGLTTPSR